MTTKMRGKREIRKLLKEAVKKRDELIFEDNKDIANAVIYVLKWVLGEENGRS